MNHLVSVIAERQRMTASYCQWFRGFSLQTYSLSSSNVFTEYRGDVGSRWRTSTWFLLLTRQRRSCLFNSDRSVGSTMSLSPVQPPSSILSSPLPQLPPPGTAFSSAQVGQLAKKVPTQLGDKIELQCNYGIYLPFISFTITLPLSRCNFDEDCWKKVKFYTLIGQLAV